MYVIAKITNACTQVRIQNRTGRTTHLMTLSDAKRHWHEGHILKTNAVFERLIEHDFDVPATLNFYRNRK